MFCASGAFAQGTVSVLSVKEAMELLSTVCVCMCVFVCLSVWEVSMWLFACPYGLRYIGK